MERLYDQALANMERTVHGLAQRVSPPQSVPYKDSFVFRYVERTLHQALVQKLARILTGLRAARLLLENGLLQEQGALQRILDELHEDVSFLALAVIYDDHTPLHQAYLDAFYEEEFDAETALESTQKRPMISRQKIRAYIARRERLCTKAITRNLTLRSTPFPSVTGRCAMKPRSAGQLHVGRSRGKAHEFSVRSLPSASSSREAAAFRSASGGSVTGADAAALVAGRSGPAAASAGALAAGSRRQGSCPGARCFSGQQWLPSWLFAQPGAPRGAAR
jgi:hypothetical protein